MIPDQEIVQIQQDVEDIALSLPCVIQEKTSTSDDMGQSSETWATIEETMAGMAEPSFTQLQNYAYLIGSLATWQVKLPVTTKAKTQNRLIIAGQTLTVQIVLSPKSYQIVTTVLATEVKQA